MYIGQNKDNMAKTVNRYQEDFYQSKTKQLSADCATTKRQKGLDKKV
jgi:hypothetical protein